MRVDVYPTAVNIPPPEELAGRTAVVIDVLRATTTICTALANGAEAVVPVLSPEEARRVAHTSPDRGCLLGGERNSVLIPGFDLSNSPLEYTEARVRGRPILFTTTNGTRAIRRAAGADRVYIASLLNAPAVAAELARTERDAAICCAGTRDQFSLEDTLCAGAILHFLSGQDRRLEMNDLGRAALDLFRRYDGRLTEALLLSEHGRNLVKLGFRDDLIFCARFGTTAILPRYQGGQVVLL